MLIASEILDIVAVPMDAQLRLSKGMAERQPDGSWHTPDRYPNGLQDWVAEVLTEQIKHYVSSNPTLVPVVQQRIEQKDSLDHEVMELCRPTVTVEASE